MIDGNGNVFFYEIRKKIALIVCLVLCTALFNACGEEKKIVEINESNVEKIVKDIVGCGAFENDMEEITKEMVIDEYKLSKNEEMLYCYMSVGALADEVTIIKSQDAKATKEKANAYIKSRKESYDSYNADEAKKLGSAIVDASGEYVIICVAKDYSKVKKVLYNMS